MVGTRRVELGPLEIHGRNCQQGPAKPRILQFQCSVFFFVLFFLRFILLSVCLCVCADVHIDENAC